MKRLAVVAAAMSLLVPSGAPRARSPLIALAESAAAAEHVPAALLLAQAWTESRFRPLSRDGGLIRLVPWRPSRSAIRASGLLAAAEPAQNGFRQAAALLADAARAAGVDVHAPFPAWAPALERFNGAADPLADALYADDVLACAAAGIVAFDADGLPVEVPGQGPVPAPLEAPPRSADMTGAGFAPFFQAAPSGWRPAPSRRVRFIVIHTTENTFPTIFDFFRRPGAPVSAHYLVRARDGFTVQMVDERAMAFHDACFNEESIGIEHEGTAADGASWFSDRLYRASARLVRDIAARHGIPLDREHVIGHSESKGCSTHTDPGPAWDWNRYMALLTAPGLAP